MTIIYNGSVGNDILMNTGQDLTDATKLEIWCQNPDGAVDKWTATKHATAGYITYTTEAGDLAVSGNYILHAYVEWGATSKHPGRPKVLLVLDTSYIALIDNVRHLIQDLDGDAPALSDEGIYYELDKSSDNELLAASNCARAIAAKYAVRVSQSHGDGSLQLDQLFQHYTKLADLLMAEYSRGKWSLTVPATGTSSPNQRKIRDSIDSNYPSRMLISDVQPQEYGTDEVE